jgi:succinate dehydrogenase (ubiquinone) membrane anchor subunit
MASGLFGITRRSALSSFSSRSLLRPTTLAKQTSILSQYNLLAKNDSKNLEARRSVFNKFGVVEQHAPNRMEGSWHWGFERGLTVALIPALGVSALYGGHPINDFFIGFAVPIHAHIGLSAIITDYVPSRKNPVGHIILVIAQYAFTLLTMYGCYIINTEDVGLTEYVKKVWKA